MAVEKGWSNVILESDCKAVVDEWNENQGKLEWEAHVHIDNSFSFLKCFKKLQINWIPRICNQVAHQICK